MKIKFMGIAVQYDEANGWSADHGNESFGYCETLEDLQAEIRDYFREQEQYEPRDIPMDAMDAQPFDAMKEA